MKITVRSQKWVQLCVCSFGSLSIILALLGCQSPPESTPIPPTDTPNLPTPTPVPPTETPAPPTATPAPPTATPIPNPWQEKAEMIQEVNCPGVGVVDGKIYLISGGGVPEGGSADWPPDLEPLGFVQVYDPATDSWELGTDIPTPRYHLSTSVVDGKIYAFGGSLQHSTVESLTTIEVYDPATDTWEVKADMPTGRTDFGTYVIDGQVYVFGGDKGCHCSVEVYDPQTESWEKRTDMPRPREHAASAMLDGQVYLFGGATMQGFVTEVDVYDPQTDTWTQIADLPKPRIKLTGGVLDGRIYAVFGNIGSGTYSSLVDVYDPTTSEWLTSGEFPTTPDFPFPRWQSSVVGFGDLLYVFGGSEHADVPLGTGNTWGFDPGYFDE